MRIRLKPWQSLLLLAAIVGVALFSIERFRYRQVRSNSDLAAFLPRNGSTTFFIDVSALRRARLLNLLAATAPAQESDYREFINETGFDYTRDAEAIAGSADASQFFFLMRGHFDWERLASYAAHHGGSCDSFDCKVPAARPARWASFRSIQPDVIALAVSANREAVRSLIRRNQDRQHSFHTDPLWIEPARSLLQDSAALPLPARILAVALQPAEGVTISLGQSSSIEKSAFELKLRARYPTAAMADATRSQLEFNTRMLKMELAREHRQPNPADLTGLMVSGAFQAAGNEVIGTWPLKQELLDSLK